MELNSQEQQRARLIATNDEFCRLSDQHTDYAKKLDALEALSHLTEEEQVDETRLKKM